MRNLILGATTAFFLGAPGLLSGAQAASIDLGLSFGAPVVQPVQFYMWNDRRYCWYDNGWHGPGYYWCGYRWRRGYGWGGPMGWHGWRHHYRHYDHRARHHYRGRHHRGDRHDRHGRHH